VAAFACFAFDPYAPLGDMASTARSSHQSAAGAEMPRGTEAVRDTAGVKFARHLKGFTQCLADINGTLELKRVMDETPLDVTTCARQAYVMLEEMNILAATQRVIEKYTQRDCGVLGVYPPTLPKSFPPAGLNFDNVVVDVFSDSSLITSPEGGRTGKKAVLEKYTQLQLEGIKREMCRRLPAGWKINLYAEAAATCKEIRENVIRAHIDYHIKKDSPQDVALGNQGRGKQWRVALVSWCSNDTSSHQKTKSGRYKTSF